MNESLSLGPTPCNEECQQLGPDYDVVSARRECIRWRDQLIRQFGEPPLQARYKISANPHDFGTYCDLEIVFNLDDESSAEYAYRVEGNLPTNWAEE